MDTAVLFCVWIRPEITKQSFEQIRLVKPSKLYIAIDGPRNENDKILIEDTLSVINVDWDCDVKYLMREENLGCKVAMSSAISWFFEHEEMGIILEDDCWADVSFFKFCAEMLNKYKDDTRIMHISGRTRIKNSYPYSYYFQKHMDCWGWASWRRAWQYFDIEMSDFQDFLKENAIDMYIIDKDKKEELLSQWKLHATHKEKSWAWIYNYNLFCQNALCINASSILVKNIGMNSEHSTHVQTNANEVNNQIVPMEFPLKHPIFIGEHVETKFSAKKKNNNMNKQNSLLYKNIWQRLLSVKNHGVHKVITIIGIRFKFKKSKT